MRKTQTTAYSNFDAFKKSFADRVHAVVRDIPKGEMMTYGEVAYKAGYPGAARAVGTLMRNAIDPALPFHRVVLASGKIGKDRNAMKRAVKLKTEQKSNVRNPGYAH